MSNNNYQKPIDEILLLSLGTIIVGSVVVFSFLIVWKECSRLINNPALYPSSWQQLTEF